MKLPLWISSCFSSRVASAESESLHFSVSKSPGPSGGVCSGVLSSFMSRRSGSRGTWDTSGTDGTKAKSVGARARGEADVVTLATARYLELFTATAKNDETSTALSDVRGAQDSMHFDRTASEHHVSRSSTFTAMGRASREPSRLGGAHHHLQLQQAHVTTGAPVSGGQRRSASSTRRSSPPCDVPPPRLPSTELSQPQGCPPNARKSISLGGVIPLGPFTNKTRSPMSGGRSRSDRLSPSAAAFLLPAPSIKSIARAQTALPAMPTCSDGLNSSASIGDLRPSASEAPVANGLGKDTTAVGRHNPLVRSSTGYASGTTASIAAGDSRLGPTFDRRTRLFTEGGGGIGSIGTSGSAHAPASRLLGHADLGAAAQAWVQHHMFPRGSSASVRGAGGGRLRRRNSIIFCRDGDVTVTGLPPSCLTSGRDPRCRKDGPVLAGGSGSIASASAAFAAEASAHLVSSADGPHGFCARGPMECSGAGCGLNFGQSGVQDMMPAVLLASRSQDSASLRMNQDNTSRCAKSIDVVHALNHGSEAGPNAARTVIYTGGAAVDSADITRVQTAHPGEGQQREGCASDKEARQQEKQRQMQQPVERHATQVLALANSSSDGQRCDWGGSSVYAPSRFSNSSRLTHGNTTAGGNLMTGNNSVISNNTLDPSLASGVLTAIAAAAASTAVVAAAAAAAPTTSACYSPTAQAAADDPLNKDNECRAPLDSVSSGDDFVGFQAGSVGIATGASLLAVEARDVTSALSRLQEACMAAVAQGEMRSQRLGRFTSTDLPKTQRQQPRHLCGEMGRSSGVVDSFERGSSMAASRIMGAVGGDPQRMATGCSTGLVGDARIAVARTGSAHTTPSASVHTAGVVTTPSLPSALGMGLALVTARGAARGCASESEPWGIGACDSDRISPESGIIMDGQMLNNAHFNCENDGASTSACARGQSTEEENAAEDAAEAYRTRMLNVLLRGDFLHDTHDSVAPGSEEEDDGVVEYRYGGFELGGGGGDADYSFRRQASFVEAVRKCGTATAAGTAPAIATGSHIADATGAAKGSTSLVRAGMTARGNVPPATKAMPAAVSDGRSGVGK